MLATSCCPQSGYMGRGGGLVWHGWGPGGAGGLLVVDQSSAGRAAKPVKLTGAGRPTSPAVLVTEPKPKGEAREREKRGNNARVALGGELKIYTKMLIKSKREGSNDKYVREQKDGGDIRAEEKGKRGMNMQGLLSRTGEWKWGEKCR